MYTANSRERETKQNKKSGRGQNLSKMKLLTKRNLYKSQPRKKKKKKDVEVKRKKKYRSI